MKQSFMKSLIGQAAVSSSSWVDARDRKQVQSLLSKGQQPQPKSDEALYGIRLRFLRSADQGGDLAIDRQATQTIAMEGAQDWGRIDPEHAQGGKPATAAALPALIDTYVQGLVEHGGYSQAQVDAGRVEAAGITWGQERARRALMRRTGARRTRDAGPIAPTEVVPAILQAVETQFGMGRAELLAIEKSPMAGMMQAADLDSMAAVVIRDQVERAMTTRRQWERSGDPFTVPASPTHPGNEVLDAFVAQVYCAQRLGRDDILGKLAKCAGVKMDTSAAPSRPKRSVWNDF